MFANVMTMYGSWQVSTIYIAAHTIQTANTRYSDDYSKAMATTKQNFAERSTIPSPGIRRTYSPQTLDSYEASVPEVRSLSPSSSSSDVGWRGQRMTSRIFPDGGGVSGGLICLGGGSFDGGIRIKNFHFGDFLRAGAVVPG